MKTKYILFDLDATLLPMDQNEFIKAYFTSLIKYLVPLGFESQKLYQSIWNSIMAVVSNDGKCTNEEKFWNEMSGYYGSNIRDSEPIYIDYYVKHFDKNKAVCGYNECSNIVIKKQKKRA